MGLFAQLKIEENGPKVEIDAENFSSLCLSLSRECGYGRGPFAGFRRKVSLLYQIFQSKKH